MSTAPVYFMSSYLECLEEKHPLQSRVRASGLQRHRRIALNFSVWLWVVLWVMGCPRTCQSAYSHPAPHQVQLGRGCQGRDLWQLLHCLLSIIQEGADAAWQRTDSLTDTVWHLASAPCSSQLSPQASQVWIPARSCGAHSVWQRGRNSGAAVLKWVMQHWCAVTVWGLCFGSREGGRAREGGSAKVTTETWYPWISAILTYFWVFTQCFSAVDKGGVRWRA